MLQVKGLRPGRRGKDSPSLDQREEAGTRGVENPWLLQSGRTGDALARGLEPPGSPPPVPTVARSSRDQVLSILILFGAQIGHPSGFAGETRAFTTRRRVRWSLGGRALRLPRQLRKRKETLLPAFLPFTGEHFEPLMGVATGVKSQQRSACFLLGAGRAVFSPRRALPPGASAHFPTGDPRGTAPVWSAGLPPGRMGRESGSCWLQRE